MRSLRAFAVFALFVSSSSSVVGSLLLCELKGFRERILTGAGEDEREERRGEEIEELTVDDADEAACEEEEESA